MRLSWHQRNGRWKKKVLVLVVSKKGIFIAHLLPKSNPAPATWSASAVLWYFDWVDLQNHRMVKRVYPQRNVAATGSLFELFGLPYIPWVSEKNLCQSHAFSKNIFFHPKFVFALLLIDTKHPLSGYACRLWQALTNVCSF